MFALTGDMWLERYDRQGKITEVIRKGVRYFRAGGYLCSGNRYLHRDVYRDVYGSIPSRYEVHHIDINPLNNDPSNLVALHPQVHLFVHAKMDRKRRRFTRTQCLAFNRQYVETGSTAFIDAVDRAKRAFKQTAAKKKPTRKKCHKRKKIVVWGGFR